MPVSFFLSLGLAHRDQSNWALTSTVFRFANKHPVWFAGTSLLNSTQPDRVVGGQTPLRTNAGDSGTNQLATGSRQVPFVVFQGHQKAQVPFGLVFFHHPWRPFVPWRVQPKRSVPPPVARCSGHRPGWSPRTRRRPPERAWGGGGRREGGGSFLPKKNRAKDCFLVRVWCPFICLRTGDLREKRPSEFRPLVDNRSLFSLYPPSTLFYLNTDVKC